MDSSAPTDPKGKKSTLMRIQSGTISVSKALNPLRNMSQKQVNREPVSYLRLVSFINEFAATSDQEKSSAPSASRFRSPSIGASPVREDRPSFENPLANYGTQSFESQEEEPDSENPHFGKALYDFTAGGVDELNLTAGEEIEIEDEVDGWYYIKKKSPGRDGKMTGLVPVSHVSEFLAGVEPDAPDVEEENITYRPSVGYDDMWAKKLLEASDAEERSSAPYASRFRSPTIDASSSMFESHGSPVREDRSPYTASVMQRDESFENPKARYGIQSFESQEEEPASEIPHFGKALYDFTAGGVDELNLIAGEEVEIEDEVDGWYYVKKKRPGRDEKIAGLVPVIYVSQS